MRVAFGSDDENETTRAVLQALADAGHEVVRPAETPGWPEIGRSVGRAVVEGRADYGVVMCWTGTGTAIAANKVPGVGRRWPGNRGSPGVPGSGTTPTCWP